MLIFYFIVAETVEIALCAAVRVPYQLRYGLDNTTKAMTRLNWHEKSAIFGD